VQESGNVTPSLCEQQQDATQTHSRNVPDIHLSRQQLLPILEGAHPFTVSAPRANRFHQLYILDSRTLTPKESLRIHEQNVIHGNCFDCRPQCVVSTRTKAPEHNLADTVPTAQELYRGSNIVDRGRRIDLIVWPPRPGATVAETC
jgi:hypothetical protein